MTQISQELIDRLRKCCEWLGKEMPEKFDWQNPDLFINNTPKGRRILINFSYVNPIEPDPLCEYPNAVHRIVKECCNKELIMRFDSNYQKWEYGIYDDSDFVIWYQDCNYTVPLHAEIEATCMAIEERMNA